ncbi:hypothetical protein [Blastococcus sp. SYSU DS0617]
MLRERTAWLWVVVLAVLALVGVGLWLVLAPSDRDRFTDRPPLADCGRTVVGPGQADVRAAVDVGKEELECFDAALADGSGAELVVESASVEGEPMVEYHRALPEGGVEVFVDYRGGGFGYPSLTWFRCPDPRTFVVAPSECEYREL